MVVPIEARAPQVHVEFAIVRDADWADMLPKVVDGDGPIDMTLLQRNYRLVIRPVFDHDTLIAEYQSTLTYGNTGIYVDPGDAEQIPSIFVPQTTVAATFPKGTYDLFFVLEEVETGGLERTMEIWRGQLYVHGGNLGS